MHCVMGEKICGQGHILSHLFEPLKTEPER